MKSLAFDLYNKEADGPLLVIVHGLFGSARNWRAIAKRLSAERPVMAVDLRNHGRSFWDATQSYEAMAEDLAPLIGGRGPADVLGHSMGGKAAMMLALTHPSLVKRLIVADIAPVSYDHNPNAHIDAMRAVPLAEITRRSEAEAALAQRVADASTRAFFLQNLEITEGAARWALNLDALEANMPRITGFPEITRQFDGPTLFLGGSASDYITAEGFARAQALFPNATLEMIEGAGHWLHAEAPRAFIDAVETFLT